MTFGGIGYNEEIKSTNNVKADFLTGMETAIGTTATDSKWGAKVESDKLELTAKKTGPSTAPTCVVTRKSDPLIISTPEVVPGHQRTAAKPESIVYNETFTELTLTYPSTFTKASEIVNWYKNADALDGKYYGKNFAEIFGASAAEIALLEIEPDGEFRDGEDAKGKSGSGSAIADDNTKIYNVFSAVKFGTKYSTTGLLYDSKENIQDEDPAKNGSWSTDVINIDTTRTYGGVVLVGNNEYDYDCAKAGSYTTYFWYTSAKDWKDNTGKISEFKSNFTVKNGFTAPQVSVDKRVIEGFDTESLRDALSIDVDMNNNTSDAASFDANFNGGVFVADKKAENGFFSKADNDGSKWTIGYVAVADGDVTFLCPINATFTTE